MNPNASTLDEDDPRPDLARAEAMPSLVIAWSADEPGRVGEVLLVPPEGGAVGRGEEGLGFLRRRPGHEVPTGPLGSPRLSRVQLRVAPTARGLAIDVVGRAPVVVDGRLIQRATLAPGAVLAVGSTLLLLVGTSPITLPAFTRPWPTFPFGEADTFGLVGESPAAWALRARVDLLASRGGHLLVTGPSGTGKELVASALHALSDRCTRLAVTRSAATLPEGILDAELFGNLRNYPNPGMPERAGLVGEAHRSTLFLDEIGELPVSAQAHLLRFLDAGEYQRLGEARVRHADVRLIAATLRAESELKFDLLARFRQRLSVPGLDARREDIVLLAGHLLRMNARRDSTIAARFGPAPVLSQRVAAALLARAWTTHVRELDHLLWGLLDGSTGPQVDGELSGGAVAVDPTTLTREDIQAALDHHAGRRDAAALELGLSSRFVLLRLMDKHGLR